VILKDFAGVIEEMYAGSRADADTETTKVIR
jgi:hypothetical protein